MNASELLTPRAYSKFVRVMIAAIYVLCPQGRAQAFEKISYGEFSASWSHRTSPFSRYLKTSLSTHYQILTIVHGPPSELIDIYIELVRPALLNNVGFEQSGNHFDVTYHPTDSDIFFRFRL